MPSKDRLLPSLLDRLTDADPGSRRPESDRFTFDLPEYRAAVFRDLDWLLNAVSPARPEDIEGLEHVSRSTLNYGMPALSGGVASGLDARQLERRMREVIQRYEPRLIADTVKVQVEVPERQIARVIPKPSSSSRLSRATSTTPTSSVGTSAGAP